LLEQAQNGNLKDADFLQCIQGSLPYAWSVVTKTAEKLHASGEPFAVNEDVPPTDEAWGQLFRLVASDAMKAAVERSLAFGWHSRTAARRRSSARRQQRRAQSSLLRVRKILNQKPELINC
jgi:hypothetical protein